jgi:hypothetical protein
MVSLNALFTQTEDWKVTRKVAELEEITADWKLAEDYIAEQERIGAHAFYHNGRREDLANEHQQAGFDDAEGYECNLRALEAEESYDYQHRWQWA